MIDRPTAMKSLGLRFNPFPPAATGAAFVEEAWIPDSWANELKRRIDELSAGEGDKAMAIVGSYGSGKTFLLQWIKERVFHERRIQPYFFDNPGVAFYDLANRLLRQVGRYELSKAIWELLYRREASAPIQHRLIELTFPEWLSQLGELSQRNLGKNALAHSMLNNDLTDDEEVAFRFAQLVVDTRERPYYEFRDFVPRSSRSLVAEREEAKYFKALIRILQRVFEVEGIAFLIDEFEDVALGKRLARRQSSEYTATLRRLLDTAHEEEFWVVLSITPEGLAQTRTLEPSLMQRFGPPFEIPLLSDSDADQLVRSRLKEARIDSSRDDLWPFDENVVLTIRPTNRAIPRRLIKVLWEALALAVQKDVSPPIPSSLVAEAEHILSDE